MHKHSVQCQNQCKYLTSLNWIIFNVSLLVNIFLIYLFFFFSTSFPLMVWHQMTHLPRRVQSTLRHQMYLHSLSIMSWIRQAISNSHVHGKVSNNRNPSLIGWYARNISLFICSVSFIMNNVNICHSCFQLVIKK